MRRARCYNCGEPVEQTGRCGVCAVRDGDGQWHYAVGGTRRVDVIYSRLDRWLDDHYYPGARDDLRHLYELAVEDRA